MATSTFCGLRRQLEQGLATTAHEPNLSHLVFFVNKILFERQPHEFVSVLSMDAFVLK